MIYDENFIGIKRSRSLDRCCVSVLHHVLLLTEVHARCLLIVCAWSEAELAGLVLVDAIARVLCARCLDFLLRILVDRLDLERLHKIIL